MPRYEISIEGSNLFVHSPDGGAPRSMGFHAMVLVEATTCEQAVSDALHRVREDPNVTTIAMTRPDLAIDSIEALRGADADGPMHGSIFCFFDAPSGRASEPGKSVTSPHPEVAVI